MGGSAEFRDGKKTQQKAKNAIDEFLDEHSFHGKGGVHEGVAYEYIAGIAEATRRKDHDLVVTINKTAKFEYEGIDQSYSSQVYQKYEAMRKALTLLYKNPEMLNRLLSDYGITIQNATVQNKTLDMTISYKDKNGKTVTQTTQFDPKISRFPGLG